MSKLSVDGHTARGSCRYFGLSDFHLRTGDWSRGSYSLLLADQEHKNGRVYNAEVTGSGIIHDQILWFSPTLRKRRRVFFADGVNRTLGEACLPFIRGTALISSKAVHIATG